MLFGFLRRFKNSDEAGEEVKEPVVSIEEMTKAQLMELAESKGIKTSSKMTKPELIALLGGK